MWVQDFGMTRPSADNEAVENCRRSLVIFYFKVLLEESSRNPAPSRARFCPPRVKSVQDVIIIGDFIRTKTEFNYPRNFTGTFREKYICILSAFNASVTHIPENTVRGAFGLECTCMRTGFSDKCHVLSSLPMRTRERGEEGSDLARRAAPKGVIQVLIDTS